MAALVASVALALVQVPLDPMLYPSIPRKGASAKIGAVPGGVEGEEEDRLYDPDLVVAEDPAQGKGCCLRRL